MTRPARPRSAPGAALLVSCVSAIVLLADSAAGTTVSRFIELDPALSFVEGCVGLTSSCRRITARGHLRFDVEIETGAASIRLLDATAIDPAVILPNSPAALAERLFVDLENAVGSLTFAGALTDRYDFTGDSNGNPFTLTSILSAVPGQGSFALTGGLMLHLVDGPLVRVDLTGAVIPEPASFGLVALGLVGVADFRRRSRL